MSDRYAPMQRLAKPFKGTANWVYIALVLAVLWYGFNFIFLEIFNVWSQAAWVLDDPALIDGFAYGDTPVGVRWNLAAFALYSLLLAIMLRVLHRARLLDLIGPFYTAFAQFCWVSVYLLPLFALLTLPSLFLPDAYQQYAFGKWLSLLPATLILLFIQISAEELV
ncbi:MAG: CPBP family intramembrane glutamic endopeptidase, partial [Octadecabacter sp.]